MTTTESGAIPSAQIRNDANLFRNRNYVLVLLNQFLAYLSNQLVIPVIPLFLVGQGHPESFIGFVLAAFNVVSFSTRPIFGKWVDKGHPRAALTTSCGLLAVASYAYLVPNLVVLFLVRAIHGLGWAGLNTAGSAWIAILAPSNRRAEAVGYFTVTQSASMALAPVVGIWLFNNYGFSPPFILAGALALLSVFAIFKAKEQPAEPAHASAAAVVEQPRDTRLIARILEPSAILGTMLLALMQFNVPAFSSYVPLYFRSIEVTHVELFFLASGLSAMLGRGVIGRWSDRVGRMRAIALGSVIQIAGLLLLGQSRELIGLALGAIVFTTGQSISHPSLYALVIDRSPVHRRGAALATYTMGFQLGSGLGAVVYGFIIQYSGYQTMYWLSIAPVLIALVVTIVNWRAADPRQPSQTPGAA